MATEHHGPFGPFRRDLAQGRLWRGAEELALRPRPLALLRYLVAPPRRLVTKAERWQHVWGGTHISDTVLRVCVQEIRMVLGDTVAAPRYLDRIGNFIFWSLEVPRAQG